MPAGPVTTNSSSSPSSTAASVISGIKQTGIGLTKPTAPSGAKISGGTVSWAEAPATTPNYIFPMTSFAVCSVANTSDFSSLLYRPLYYYGNGYTPTVDYNYSVGQKPVFTDNDSVVTIKLNPWKWSDGEAVTSRDVELWINIYKANTANYCGYVPGLFPDNVTSMSTPNASTIVLHLNKSYDPEWFIYNELSQITPLPLAWDRTSLSQKAPTSDTGNLPDTTKAGALKVYNFLNTQSKDLGTWVGSSVWDVVDGPWKLSAFTSDGEATFVPNPTYSGSPKPTIAKFVELPYTSDTAAFNEFSSGGPSAVTIGYLPPQDVPQVPGAEVRWIRLQHRVELLVRLLPAELQQPDGRAGLQAAVLPPGVPAPGRPAGLDHCLHRSHGHPDDDADSSGAAEPVGFGQRDRQPAVVLGCGRQEVAHQ